MKRCLCVIGFLAIATLVVYGQTRGHQFVHYDDNQYIYENRHVKGGLTLQNVVWAFTTTDAANWHPITWLSHMLDVQLFGAGRPGLHHLHSVLIHIINSGLLFFVLARMTKAFWASTFVAAMFALHPIHVESVAWVSERKDVLCVFFALLSLWAYVRYAECRRLRDYALVMVCMALGLMCKPMLVTLPFVLLLLDVWPLGRWTGRDTGIRVIVEKLPLFALTLVSCIISMRVQGEGGAIGDYPLDARLTNAVVSYAIYLRRLVWPSDLYLLYPFPGMTGQTWSRAVFAGSAALLVLLTAGTLLLCRKRRYLVIGWLWFLGTMVPVTGIVQVGAQGMADRYAYLPFIGLYVVAAFGFQDLIQGLAARRVIGGAAIAVTVIASMITAFVQVSYWRDTFTLFERSLAYDRRNYIAHNNLGVAYGHRAAATQEAVHYERALHHFQRAFELNSNEPMYADNIGQALLKLGNESDAFRYFHRAIQIDDQFIPSYVNLGGVLDMAGKFAEAIMYLEKAIDLAPDDVKARVILGAAYRGTGRHGDAAQQFAIALDLDPSDLPTHVEYINALVAAGQVPEAIRAGGTAIQRAVASGRLDRAEHIRHLVARLRAASAGP